MIDDVPAVREVLARRLPGYRIGSVKMLGQGLDNLVYEVNGELLVRAAKQADPAVRGERIRREAELLGVLAGLSTLPVPRVVFADPPAGVLACAKLPGRPLPGHRVPEPARLAAPLGEFLTGLHRAPVPRMAPLAPRDADPPDAWLRPAQDAYRRVAARIPGALRPPVERFLAAAPPPAPAPGTLVFCHHDLGAEHLLAEVESSTITGVIDWSDAAIADPAYDLALILRDLGPEIFEMTLRRYGGPWSHAHRERVIFYARCAVLEDIAYGVQAGAPVYTDAGLAHLPPLFT